MRGMVPPDRETGVSDVRSAVIYAPRKGRKRFAANCVEICAGPAAASAQADPAKQRYAAQVVGPSKSSEGQYLYYLLKWL